MIYANSLSRLDSLSAKPDEEAKIRCAYAKQYEDTQDFLKACDAMGKFWTGIGIEPDVTSLSDYWAAEVWLRVGALTGWRGSAEQVENSQEIAKNFITISLEMFQSTGDVNKQAEAYIETAICYWREGAYNEACSLFDHAWKLAENESELKLRILYNRSLIEWARGKHKEALLLQEKAEPLFEASTYYALRCKQDNAYAISLKTLGIAESREDYIDRAIQHFTASAIYAERVGNSRHVGFVENNLGSLYFTLKLYNEALEHLLRAKKIFTRIKDHSCVGQTDETRAQVLLALDRPHEAAQLSKSSVKIFEQSGELSLLAESLTTHGIALARLKKTREATATFIRASETAKQVGDYNKAGIALLSLLEESPCLSQEVSKTAYEEAFDLFKNNQDASITERLAACRSSLRMSPSKKPQVRNALEPDMKVWEGLTLREARYKLEEWMMRKAILDSGGNFSKAARLVGITPAGFHDKVIKEYPHLKALQRTVHKKSDGAVLRDVSKLTSNLELKQGTLVLIMQSEALSGNDIHTNDRLVVNTGESPETGSLVAIRYDMETYVGFYREVGSTIEIGPSAVGFTTWTFEKNSVDILGCVVAKMKAEDAEKLKSGMRYVPSPPFLPI